jgi:hypothetical protein
MATLFDMGVIRRGAEISDDGLYRYSLTRVWDETGRQLCWIMLNPSTADSERDDPTIRKLIGFSKRWGFGGFAVVNLFGYRATKPTELQKVSDPVGIYNDRAVTLWAEGRTLVAAWGSNAKIIGTRAGQVGALLAGRSCYALKVTDAGYPWHPLYVPYETMAVPFWRGGENAEIRGYVPERNA